MAAKSCDYCGRKLGPEALTTGAAQVLGAETFCQECIVKHRLLPEAPAPKTPPVVPPTQQAQAQPPARPSASMLKPRSGLNRAVRAVRAGTPAQGQGLPSGRRSPPVADAGTRPSGRQTRPAAAQWPLLAGAVLGVLGLLAGGYVLFQSSHVKANGVARDAASGAAAAQAAGGGLRGRYYASLDLSAAPALTRVDAAVDFDWGTGAPAPGLPADRFSVQWRGILRPKEAGVYGLAVQSDGACSLWLGGTKVLDAADRAAPSRPVRIQMEKDHSYELTYQYQSREGRSFCRLLWTPPGGTETAIPPGCLTPEP